MTFLSVTDCCHQLGIDAKTLRRWLAQAQLSLQTHPTDGRLKGVSREHLRRLATAHHRSLAALPEEGPAPAPPPEPSPVPPTLVALLCTLSELPAQIAALQQQVAELTRLLEPHGPAPIIPAAPTKPSRTAKRPPTPTRPAARARRAAKPSHKPTHVIPRVEYGGEGHYVVICPKQGLLAFEPDSPPWFAWVAQQSSFRFVGKGGRLTAHHEWRIPNGAWRAHRQIRNHSYTLRLAPNQELTIAVLEQAAEALQAHLT